MKIRPRVPGCDRAGVGERSYPMSEFRGGGQKELHHAQGQGQPLRGPTPRPKSSGCTGAGGPRGATPHSRSGGAAVRRYHSSKVRRAAVLCCSNPEEIPHVQGKRNPSKTVDIARSIREQAHKA